MAFTPDILRAIAVGEQENRVEQLRQILGYPVIELDPEGGKFWYLRPGENKDDADETCPIAVGFYDELNDANEQQIKQLLTKEKQQAVYGHYTSIIDPVNRPVMYLLLPTGSGVGRIPLVLPTEGGLRQRQIQTFGWADAELVTRLNRLKQDKLRIASKGISSIPQVDCVFYPTAKTAAELARSLAEAARTIEKVIPKIYNRENKNGYLHKLLASFQKELLPTLKLESDNEKDYSFADIYAQTIAYALFTARVFSYIKDERDGTFTHFDRETAWQRLPETNPFLRKLFKDISKQAPEALGDELIDAINNIFGILRAAKMDAILLDFQSKMNREDIVIRFYEDFLAAYKPEMRERRGVYYTPEPVVSYMVRSVDILLKEKFDKPLGLADPEVMILDPACGTGTYLLWICQLIYQRFQESPEALTEGLADKSWSSYVKERLLPRIFGFELLMAPYAIAHLKLGLFLDETGYQFDGNKRLGIYLTNTLDDAVRKTETLFEEFIAEEADQATEIKQDKPIMVVVGNPPYEGESTNKNLKWINNLVKGISPDSSEEVENYFEVDGVSLKSQGERNTKWLNNDYVKFMRFAHWRIEKTGYGILAFITDRSYLGGSTFRGMRQSLMKSFDYLYLLDLHGNVRGKRKDLISQQIQDENVFAISQGTVINLFIKTPQSQPHTNRCYREDIWGKWEDFKDLSRRQLIDNCKSAWLTKNDVATTNWSCIDPSAPLYILEKQANNLSNDNPDNNYGAEYSNGWKITNIFRLQSMGITGGRDKSNLSPRFSKNEMWELINDFVCLPESTARQKYCLGKDARDWKVCLAQADIINSGLKYNKVLPILYRPFDTRFTYYTGKSRGFHCMPRNEVMKNLITGENLAICFVRSSREGVIANFFVSENITDKTILSASDNANIAPLYIYPDTNTPKELQESVRANFSQDFLNAIADKLGYTPTPEAIFYYIYAIFHSDTYRTRYAEFLKIDFPRVPLISDRKLFSKLSALGEELVNLHLMRSPTLNNPITKFVENQGNRLVGGGKDIEYSNDNNGTIKINKKGDKFTDVPKEVWEFYVGGYKVCQKWLKDRKGRTLSDEDIQHYQRIVVALKETIGLMEQIDATIPGFPIE